MGKRIVIALGGAGRIGAGRLLGAQARVTGAHLVLGRVGLQNALSRGARGDLAPRALGSPAGRSRRIGSLGAAAVGIPSGVLVHSHG